MGDDVFILYDCLFQYLPCAKSKPYQIAKQIGKFRLYMAVCVFCFHLIAILNICIRIEYWFVVVTRSSIVCLFIYIQMFASPSSLALRWLVLVKCPCIRSQLTKSNTRRRKMEGTTENSTFFDFTHRILLVMEPEWWTRINSLLVVAMWKYDWKINK